MSYTHYLRAKRRSQRVRNYDGAGNLVQKENVITHDTWVYGYNNANEMISAKDYTAPPTSGGTLISDSEYKYDGFGNRIEQDITTGSGTTVQRYAYDWTGKTSPSVGT